MALSFQFRLLVAVSLPLMVSHTAYPDGVHNMAGNKHLFLDEFLLTEVKGAHITVNPAETGDLVVFADRPWEAGGITSYGNVLWDSFAKEYRMYYVPVCWDVQPGFCLALATSMDGIHWEKPSLGVVEWKGSKDNNIVIWAQREGTVVIVPGASPEKRYAYVSSNPDTGGTRLFTSPDGIHFTQEEVLLSQHHSDSQIATFWDNQLEKFIHHFKLAENDRGVWYRDAKVTVAPNIPYPQSQLLGRCVGRIEVANLADPWPDHFEVVMARDEQDPPAMDLYTNSAEKYALAPDTYFAFPTPYYHYNEPANRAYLNTPTLEAGGKTNDGVIETQLATSHDGRIWTRYRTPYIPLHRFEDMDLRVIHAYPGILYFDDHLVHYYAAYNFTHGDTQVRKKNLGRELGGVFRMKQRIDGFTSLDFDYTGGTTVTAPFLFEGKRLVLNVDTSASGEGRIAILDADGKEIPGFGLEEARFINGDYLAKTASWKDGTWDVGSLSGKPVRLKLVFRGSKVYSFQFKAE